MFSLYSQVITCLGYPQEFSSEEIKRSSLSVDELAGFIALTDCELDNAGFFAECDRIDEAIRSLGYEI